MENVNWIAISISLLSSMASIAIAIAALRNSRISEKNNELARSSFELAQKSNELAKRSNDAKIYLDMMDIYMSKEFKYALKAIRTAQEKEIDTFPAEWFKSHQSGEQWAKDVDDARRKVKYFYRNVAQLYNENLISFDLVKAICKPQGWRVLIELIEPMEQISNSHYNRSTYEIIKQAGAENEAEGLKPPSRIGK
ncbi:hypothetical protein [Pseudoalteromonas luteoviolacea]|uniref:DUF4760 domain-containing protein n=1 Tax=Pseudoalteromonas luteoviolacea S4054 TaxID=1129367 RepID=A0A0F6AEY8_9GAMM|nr:hypothetical protein [Pseudoalteromonas luteoviolacea]AOT08400.1 hypothetical protein S4054249_11325 [Pseudoalteromonas luteoviolacea]AOT13316.1 hypothetical protein S40542_11300 [Pseudoalteromonas luteoviolacea]AOT18229.1 hypothetical protein S4054_11300 [Pseudoalteromonas luteoviolacea]KKE84787.1 hypothetical protein N479_00950 [Pseudoalteromonas luteoviolacea S4054]KZN76046.1 hypothetical protein N481_06765 [Pseudoalteromonas luteoviolacea S4047-1]